MYIHSLSALPTGIDMLTGIDITGCFKKLFGSPLQIPGCMFLLCTRGHCTVTVHLTEYSFTEGNLAVIFPNQFFQVSEQSSDCRFIFIAFSQKLMQEPELFSKIIEYVPSIFETPVVVLSPKARKVFHNYFWVITRALKDLPYMFTPEHQTLVCTQLIIGISSIYKQENTNKKQNYNRNEEIVKNLMRIVVENYKTERNISFYAEKMHLSPQHLSSTIKKATGKTLTDIISNLVIRDAQGKLRSTELTIQEIAYSLNFPDISFFGKYFKRYTGISPKQYRNRG